MALIGNHSILNRASFRQIGGTNASGYAGCFTNSGSLKNQSYGGFANFAATPVGYTHPIAYILARKSGGLASFFQLSGSISLTDAAMARGLNLVGDGLTASISETNAVLALIVGLEAALSAGITLTDAQLAIIIELQASLNASGTITDAQLGNILNLLSSLSAAGAFSDAAIVNLINLSADITSVTELSPEGLANSLLDNSDIETGFSLRETLRLVLASVAGKVSGAGTTTITFRNVPDDKNRIVATVDSNGNRSSITYDVED